MRLRYVRQLYADAFRDLPAAVWQLSIGLLINRAGTMVMPFLSLYLVRELGWPTTDAAVVLFAFGLGSMVGSYAGGALSDRWNPIRVQIGSLVASGAVFLSLTQLHSLVTLTLGVLVAGAVNDAFRPACMTAAIEASPPPIQARALGLIRLAANAGMGIGPAVGGLLAGIDYVWIFVGEAVTCWLAAVWLWRRLRGYESTRHDPRAKDGTHRRSLWTDGPLLALLALIFVAVLVLFQVFNSFPLYLTSDYGLNEVQVGLIFAFNAALIVVFEMILIKLMEHRAPALTMGFGLFLLCAGFGLMPLGRGLAFAALTVVVWTVGEMLALPFANVLVARRAGPGRVGEAMGMYMVMFSVAFLVAPVGLPVLDRFGGDVLWTVAGLLGIPIWIFTVMLAPSLREPAP